MGPWVLLASLHSFDGRVAVFNQAVFPKKIVETEHDELTTLILENRKLHAIVEVLLAKGESKINAIAELLAIEIPNIEVLKNAYFTTLILGTY